MKQSVPAESEHQQRDSTQRKPTDTPPLSQAFVDNRQSTRQMRQMRAAMNNSPQAIAQRKLSEQINNSPRMIAQRQQFARITDAVQRVKGDELLQGKFEATQRAEAPSAKQNNTGLPDNLKSGIEHLSGLSMDHVKVHYNSSQPAQLNALAYAQGTDIHVAPGQEKHLPHEAWHVAQQAQGRVKPTMQMAGQHVNDDRGLEKEADLMGERASSVGIAQGKSKSIESDPIDSSQVKKLSQLRKMINAANQAIQRVPIAAGTINCPGHGDAAHLGTVIHGFVEANYLNWGYAGAGNTRATGHLVLAGHRPDLEVLNAGGNVVKYGELKPQGQEGVGRTQIQNTYNDPANTLTAHDQVNAPAWAAQVLIPVRNIDPHGTTADGTGNIKVNQDGTETGLYIYHG